MKMDDKGPGFTGAAKLAVILVVLGLGGVAGATFMNIGRGVPDVAAKKAYPKLSASALAARRASSGGGGGGYYRTTRYGTSSRSYGGGGYSGGK